MTCRETLNRTPVMKRWIRKPEKLVEQPRARSFRE